ncbi:MAG: aldose 1-epimerase family protein, partial [Pseudomonadota bacterium]|nr:aldose 1-epimerase family protein [Pseudomonadota bacterium]
TLSHRSARAEVALLGGELRAWREGEHDLLWQADAHWWPRSSPVLFPTVGHLREGRATIGGKRSAMPAHGFAASQVFSVRGQSTDRVELGLISNETTRAAYPFEFDLSLAYRLDDEGLEVRLRVTNTGRSALPYAIGLHPGLRWPFAADSAAGHAVVFERDESPLVPTITEGGLFTTAQRKLPLAGRRLSLDAALFAQEALCFLNARSSAVRFEAPNGAAIAMRADNFSHWALWSKPGAPLLCIEAWTGHGDAADFDGELADRPSTRHLAPGLMSEHGLNLRFEAARR